MQNIISITARKFLALALVCLATASISLTANATEIRKVFDGTAAYCPPKETYKPIVPETALRAAVDGQELVISLNVCDGGQWQLAPSLPAFRYTAPNGELVEINFESFRLIVQTPDWNQTKFIPLANFSGQASARLAMNDIEFVDVPALDISLTAVRTTKTSSGHTFTEDVTWGSLRLLK